MPEHERNIRLILITTPIILGMALTLSACGTKEAVIVEGDRETTSLPSATDEIETPTPQPLKSTAQITVDPPAIVPSGNQVHSGLIILAMQAGRYSQLFAYHPVNLPLKQLTSAEWNHDSPSISPDGTKLAYCADESGRWDIYILNLVTGNTERLTETESYACAPTWSPDGRWLAFEEVMDGKLNIVIRSVTDPSTAPVRLTNNGGNNFEPAWSPKGREIAFVTDRNGRLEIWLADLDDPEQRFKPVIRSDTMDYTSPAWSADGSTLAWLRLGEFNEIEIWETNEEDSFPVTLGYGSNPVWMDNAEGVLAQVRYANGIDLVAYGDDSSKLIMPPIHLPNNVTAVTWVTGSREEEIKKYASTKSAPEVTALWQTELSTTDIESGIYDLIYLSDVVAPEPYLSDTVNESYSAMRAALQAELGWDFLKILNNASISIPANASPGLEENWLFTGRGIAVNLDPLNSGWMVVNREDFLGRTYWRVWLKCMDQDGTCGVPIHSPAWDFNSRVSGNAEAYEEGGMVSTLPNGFWIDFTSFARNYGWERLPAGSNWRGYFPETMINLFVMKGGLSWDEAIRERYSIDTVGSLWPSQ